jgi:hypothetical protein
MARTVRFCTAVPLNSYAIITVIIGVNSMVPSRISGTVLSCLHASLCVPTTFLTKEHTHEPV